MDLATFDRDPANAVRQAAWGWATSHRRRFQLPSPVSRWTIEQLKPLGELVLTADILRRTSLAHLADEFSESIDATFEFAWTQLQEGELIASLLQSHPDLFGLTSLYATFSRNGYRNTTVDNAIATLSAMTAIRALEFPPWRALDIALALEQLGIQSSWIRRNLFEQTWLSAKPEPWMINSAAAYALTHTVFYMTDFGEHPANLPPDVTEYLTNWLPVWCEFYFSVNNLDLLGELLMVASCVGLNSLDPLLEPAWDQLRRAQAGDGLVPGPHSIFSEQQPNPQLERAADFYNHYHTTLVAAMASALWMRTHHAPLGSSVASVSTSQSY